MKQRRLTIANYVVFVMVITCCLLTRGEGRLLGMSEGMTIAAVISLFALAFILAGLLVVKGSWVERLTGVAIASNYVVMLLPSRR